MRLAVWWGAIAFALLAVSAQRTTQVDGSRGRRLPSPSSTENSDTASSTKDAESVYRVRGFRRREESSSVPTREVRTRGRPAATPEATDIDRPESSSARNERFDSRRTRTRNRPVENEATVGSSTTRSNVIRSRTRTTARQSSFKPVEASSEKNSAVDNSSLEKIPIVDKKDVSVTNQFRRRSFASHTTENVLPTQYHGRNSRRNNARALDLADTGAASTATTLAKEPTTSRSTEDPKTSRKLRYKTRFSEVDSNLTGEGMVTPQEKVKKAAELTETNANLIDQSTESLKALSTESNLNKPTQKPETNATSSKIIKRVPIRRKVGFKPAIPTSVKKISDEISEDDNYPESFKALLQAKSASTQVNSPPSESLSVKESQTVYKTYVPSSQSTDTDLTSENDSGFKRKSMKEMEKMEIDSDLNDAVSSTTLRGVGTKSRVLFKPRTRKSSFSTTIKSSTNAEITSSTEKPAHKYNRKLKFTTTQPPKVDKSKDKDELRSKWKKPLIRQSYISRRKPEGNESVEQLESSTTRKPKPTRNELLSKYSRNNRFKSSTSTTENTKMDVMVDQSSTEKLADNSANMPFIITLLSSTENAQQDPVTDRSSESYISKDNNNVFIIAVSSTESGENKLDYRASVEEQTGNRPVVDVTSTTSKYNTISENGTSETSSESVSPVVRNVNLRNRDRYNAATEPPATQKNYRGRYNRKYHTENSAKTTDGAANVITPEPERQKGRFSSKYRSSHIEKPIYKATVPTVTPSTAWLKFFVTDHLLTNTPEEPIWFDEADFYTTEPMPRQFITSSPYIHEPSYQLVEGEEIQLGPNTNAFSITQTRRPLSSANLRLSESLEKPSHIMNVEASQHSPSVTVSIFGALADVLTSTPRTRISTTTDVTQKLNNNIDVNESLIDVSKKNNVNNSEVLTSQDNSINKDVNTVQTTANVINNLSVGESVTKSLSTNIEVNPKSSLSTTPNPTSTTPISARRPFAFKVLYSNTETPTDILKTASTNQLSTDSSSNTVSDILIPSNNFVSSELTSMLTNNIRNILANMNETDKSKLSVDMAQLLKSLIPKALDRRTTALDDVDIAPNTTPYTLEDIQDTQNIETGIIEPSVVTNSLQSESSNLLVNSTLVTYDGFVPNEEDQVVNSNININAETDSQILQTESTINKQVSFIETTTNSQLNGSTDDESGLLERNNISIESTNGNKMDKILPVPFFTNSQVEDDDSTSDNLDKDLALAKTSIGPSNSASIVEDTNQVSVTSILPTQQELSNNGQNSVQITPVQLWVLSRKAKVLQMIEELIRQHNDEIATIPLTGLLDSTNDVQLSDRLTKIIGNLNGTVTPTDVNDAKQNDFLPISTTPSFLPYSIPPSISTTQSESISDSVNVPNAVPTDKSEKSDQDATTPAISIEASADTTTNTIPTPDVVMLQSTENSVENLATVTSTPLVLTTPSTVTEYITPGVDLGVITQTRTSENSETTISPLSVLTTTSTVIEITTPAIGISKTTELNSEEKSETTTGQPFLLTTVTSEAENFTPFYDSSVTSVSSLLTSEKTFTTINTISLETSTNIVPTIDTITTQDMANSEILTTTTSKELETTPTESTLAQENVNNNNDISSTTPSTNSSTESTQQTTEIPFSTSSPSIRPVVASETVIPKKDYVIFGILPNNTVVRKDPNDDILETITETSPYIIYGVLPNNTIIRRFPNGTRVPRVMQKIDVLPISPWSLKNPYSPIHNNPAIVRPKSNPIQVNTITETSTDTSSNENENQLTTDTVYNLQNMIPPSTLNVNGSSSFGLTNVTNKPPAESSTASHVLSLRTSTMLPSVDEILLNSISSAIKENMVLSEQKMPTDETRILTLDIDPETKQIRTEKPSDGSEGPVFKFIPVDQVTVPPTDTNVLKITPPKETASNTETPYQMTNMPTTVTESQTPGKSESLTTVQETLTTTEEQRPVFTNPSTTMSSFDFIETKPNVETTAMPSSTVPTTTTTEIVTTVASITTTPMATTTPVVTTTPVATTTPVVTTTPFITTTTPTPTTVPTTTTTRETTVRTTFVPFTEPTTVIAPTTKTFKTTTNSYQDEAALLASLLKSPERNPKNLNGFSNTQSGKQQQENLLNALLQSTNNVNGNKIATTTPRSLEDDLKQLEEDTKLLKALLAATGQDPSKLNLPTLPNFNIPSKKSPTTTSTPITTTPTTNKPTTTFSSSTQSANEYGVDNDKLLASLLQAGSNTDDFNKPVISGDTSQVRIASNLRTTSRNSNPTTPYNLRPVYTTTTLSPTTVQTSLPPIVSFTNLQPEIVTEDIGGISTTFSPRTSTARRRTPSRRFTSTTEIPSTSTFSVQEDLMFLQNLKTVLKTNTNAEDPEAALANRIIALAVERSLNEIQTGDQTVRTDSQLAETTTIPTTTTTLRTTTTTTTPVPTTTQTQQTPSLEEDIKKFEEDTKLLKALIQATGQDPSSFNIPTLPSIITTTVSSANNKIFTNSLTSRTLKPFRPSTQRAIITTAIDQTTVSTSARPFGARIAVKDNLKTTQDDEKLLKTLVKLQGVQETTTQKRKLALTGQTRDEALNSLIKKKRPGLMETEATISPMSLSTEYGKSKDALLAALLKEQGFGPTTASSLDEQQRLSALLNQVVVTPKARRTTTLPPPPPPAQRRPILDGLAWLWQQWQETGPGPGGSRPQRPASSPASSSSVGGGQRVNWFGSGPFVGNADDGSSSNRIPLEPPGVVTSQQAPGRGQFVSAAINVTRAFSQFLGAAIQGAAQTVQNVFRAGQRVTADAYTNGSGGSG